MYGVDIRDKTGLDFDQKSSELIELINSSKII
jgi:hypothetical protein